MTSFGFYDSHRARPVRDRFIICRRNIYLSSHCFFDRVILNFICRWSGRIMFLGRSFSRCLLLGFLLNITYRLLLTKISGSVDSTVSSSTPVAPLKLSALVTPEALPPILNCDIDVTIIRPSLYCKVMELGLMNPSKTLSNADSDLHSSI
jgi:hypothetical protein